MSSTIFPILAATTSLAGKSYTVPSGVATQKYQLSGTFNAAVYTITTSPTTIQATITFANDSQIIGTTTTVSGAITYNLQTPATIAYVSINSSSTCALTITAVADALSGSLLSGTLDTITTTSTYNQTGKLYVACVGGGGGGGFGYLGSYPATGGSGGNPGQYIAAIVHANGPTSISIGTGGTGGTTNGASGNSGGTTNFGNLLSANGGGYQGTAGAGYGAAYAGNGPNAVTDYTLTGNSTNGGGAAGSSYNTGSPWGGPATGSGIGTGGGSGNPGGTATGYGAGGGGGDGSNSGNAAKAAGGAGSPGVVYVLRGF